MKIISWQWNKRASGQTKVEKSMPVPSQTIIRSIQTQLSAVLFDYMLYLMQSLKSKGMEGSLKPGSRFRGGLTGQKVISVE